MESETGSLDYWRNFFRTAANSDIIEVINRAILVATSDCPDELRRRRDQITEKLYAYHRCNDCDRADSKSNCSDEVEELDRMASSYGYNEAAALTEEIEEESQTVGEVLRIKGILSNHQDESDNVLFESLRRLQLMGLSLETMKATDIGRAVNGLRKHHSKQIRHLVRTLIEDWKLLVEEWARATASIANFTDNSISPDSIIPTDMDEEEGLPSPPLDEGAFFLAAPTTSIQLSEFFDGMDDDGNFRISDRLYPEDKGQIIRQESVVKQAKPLEVPDEHATPKGIYKGEMRRQEPSVKQTKDTNIDKEDMRRQGPVVRQTKPRDAHMTADSGPGRPSKNLSPEKKVSCEMNSGVQKKPQSSSHDKNSLQATTDSRPGRPQQQSITSLQDKSKNSEDSLLRKKLEAAKRKLHENYQQAENAKKQRTIQVMELHDIPKMARINRHTVPKHKSNIRGKFS